MFKGLYILFFFAGILAIESCKNDDEVFKTVLPAFVNVVNASPDTLNFYLNGTRQNNSSNLFPTGQSTYINIPEGSQNIQFKNAGAFQVLFSVPLTLKDSLDYSLYIAGTSADKSFVLLDRLYIDTVTNSTQIRFINASPDAGSLDFYAGDTINYKSLAFKGASGFLPTGAGIKQVKIYQSGSANPIIDTPMTFQPGSIYTVFSKGLLKGKGTAAFDVALSLNSSTAF